MLNTQSTLISSADVITDTSAIVGRADPKTVVEPTAAPPSEQDTDREIDLFELQTPADVARAVRRGRALFWRASDLAQLDRPSFRPPIVYRVLRPTAERPLNNSALQSILRPT